MQSCRNLLQQDAPVALACRVRLCIIAHDAALAACLLLPCVCGGFADAISSSIQQNALQAGGFAAIAAPLAQEELAAGTLAGGLFRGLLLQGLCLMAAAFDLSPWTLPAVVLQQLVDLLVTAVEGGQQLGMPGPPLAAHHGRLWPFDSHACMFTEHGECHSCSF